MVETPNVRRDKILLLLLGVKVLYIFFNILCSVQPSVFRIQQKQNKLCRIILLLCIKKNIIILIACL